MNELLIAVVIALAMWGLVSWLIRRGRVEYQTQAAVLERISALSIQEAERRALALLNDEKLFRCVEASIAASTSVMPLAEGVQRLFARYASVETVGGPKALIDRDLIKPSALRPEFICIGRGMEGTDVEFELGVRARQEPVYEIYSGESPDPTFGTYSSVYHWIVAVANEDKQARVGR